MRRPVSSPHNPGLWEAPGGKANPGEPLDVTATRELEEETGLRLSSVGLSSPELLRQYVINEGARAGTLIMEYGSIALHYEGDINLDPVECTDFQWATKQWLT
ncbi:MAG: NUDIX domain-containing protein [Candidatus Saccharimonadales bacterium]